MNTYLLFAFTVIMPVAAALIITLLERFTKFRDMKSLTGQIIAGIIFSFVAVLATVWGFQEDLSVINVRDAAPICAAFIFGPVSGIISAVVGGVYRLISGLYFGVGYFSAVACSLSTVLIGLAAALSKKLKKENNISLFFTVIFCVVSESMHMLLIFLTNINRVTSAYYVVSSCFIPMTGFTTLSVAASMLVSGLIRKDFSGLFVSWKIRYISDVMERMLIAGMIGAYLLTGVLTYFMQINSAVGRTNEMLQAETSSVMENLELSATHHITKEMFESIFYPSELFDSSEPGSEGSDENSISEKKSQVITEFLNMICRNLDVIRADLLSSEFTVVYSSDSTFTGQRTDNTNFIRGLSVDGYYVESYIDEYADDKTACAGINIQGNNILPQNLCYLRITYDVNKLKDVIESEIRTSTSNLRFGNAGLILITDSEPYKDNIYMVIKPSDEYLSNSLPDYIDFLDPSKTGPYSLSEVKFEGKTRYMFYTKTNELYYIALLTKEAALLGSNISIIISLLMEILIFALLSLILYIGIRIHVVKNLRKINSDLGEICKGNLDVTVDVRSNREFSILSDDINSTVDTLKHYIDAEAARIDNELTLAHSIQSSSLPRVFPPFPSHTEFDIYALMTPAREVGGDFYDFFFVDETTLAFLIADVSGKGIPAALFMMTTRTTLKQLALQGKKIDEVFEIANRQLYETNPSRIFVTAWMGMLNISTGELRFVNAGHNAPLLKKDGNFEYLRDRTGFVLAGRKNSRYSSKTITLSPHDCLFLYTDGVTEAVNREKSFYKEERLKDLLNGISSAGVEDICESVFNDVNSFAEGCEQADDMTVLCVTYNGKSDPSSYENRFTAEKESTAKALAFVRKTLSENGISKETTDAFLVCTDELFSNIVKYAYDNDRGYISLQIEICKNRVSVTFADSGKPFDPLNYTNREIASPVRKRKPGGLGIFLVKKLMDNIEYCYENDENRLTIIKDI